MSSDLDAPTLPTVDLTGSLAGDLHGVLREAALRGPLATDVLTGATVVLRYRDVETLAHDPRLHGIGLLLFDMMGITDGPLRDWYGRLMFTTEGEYHHRIRSLVARAFTPRSVEALRATAAAMAAEGVAAARRDGGDLVPACSGLATRLTCRLLGVPDSDVEVFSRWADALSPIFYVMSPEQITAAAEAIEGLLGYVHELASERAQDPGPDLISALLAAEADGERLTREETVTMIANLLVAGHDTTGSQIPCVILVALQHRDELAGIIDNAVRLTNAASEAMRLEPAIPMIPRTAVQPIDIEGNQIPAGAMMLLCTASASRDGTVWRDADSFDADRFSRPGTPRLLSFGAGVHYCLGAALARIAVEECMRAVLSADPPLRLAEDPAGIPWRVVLGRSPTRLLVL
jgi:cytochrome P450